MTEKPFFKLASIFFRIIGEILLLVYGAYVVWFEDPIKGLLIVIFAILLSISRNVLSIKDKLND